MWKITNDSEQRSIQNWKMLDLVMMIVDWQANRRIVLVIEGLHMHCAHQVVLM
jgi:hypothetical protein